MAQMTRRDFVKKQGSSGTPSPQQVFLYMLSEDKKAVPAD